MLAKMGAAKASGASSCSLSKADSNHRNFQASKSIEVFKIRTCMPEMFDDMVTRKSGSTTMSTKYLPSYS